MIYNFGDYRLDSEQLELRRGEQSVEVEPQVFRLLLFLVENRERVIGKDELLAEVWRGRVVSDAALNSRINAARRAIGDDGKTQGLIKTFPRRGFRFIGRVEEQPGIGRGRQPDREVESPVEHADTAAERKPVLLVLPLHALGDPDDGFGEGLESMMVTELSRRTGVDVISRQAARGLATRPVDFTQIRETVGADYALTGSVQRIGERVRVSVQLCETLHGKQIWSERYDRELGDSFSVQDELTHLILMSARWNMAAHDGERAALKPDGDLSLGDRLARAAQYFYTPTPESYRAAIALLDGALEDEPRHPMALSMRAFAEYVSSTFRVAPMPREEGERAKRMVDVALEENERSDFAHWVRGTLALNLDRDHDAALAHATRAHEVNPHFAPSLRLKGETLCFGEDPAQGIAILEELVSSDPRAPGNAIAFWDTALARFALDDPPGALAAIDEALLRIRTMPDFYLARAAILSESDHGEEASRLVEHLLARFDSVTVSAVRRPPYRDSGTTEKYLRALRGAGVPD